MLSCCHTVGVQVDSTKSIIVGCYGDTSFCCNTENSEVCVMVLLASLTLVCSAVKAVDEAMKISHPDTKYRDARP